MQIVSVNCSCVKMSAFQLAWNEFNSCTSSTFQDLYTDKEFTDVTLATDDNKQLKAHKVILSSCLDADRAANICA